MKINKLVHVLFADSYKTIYICYYFQIRDTVTPEMHSPGKSPGQCNSPQPARSDQTNHSWKWNTSL